MKSHTFFSITAVFCILVLSACTAETETGLQTTQPQGSQSSQFTAPRVPDNLSETATTIQGNVQYSESDLALLKAAEELNDNTYCERISDQNLSEKCKKELLDTGVRTEATEKLDPKLCEQLSSKDAEDACKIEIEVQLKQDEKLIEQKQLSDSEQLKSNEFVATGNYSGCKELTLPNQVKDCELNILSNKAIDEKDTSWCDKASTEKNIQDCILLYQMSTGTAPLR
jgi:hypothetical protein